MLYYARSLKNFFHFHNAFTTKQTVTQPLWPRYVADKRQTDELWQYRALHYVHRSVNSTAMSLWTRHCAHINSYAGSESPKY